MVDNLEKSSLCSNKQQYFSFVEKHLAENGMLGLPLPSKSLHQCCKLFHLYHNEQLIKTVVSVKQISDKHYGFLYTL